jgi:YidC/Oxa1 family membrane protein insertase
MSNEKRLILCVVLIFLWVMVAPSLFQSLGLMPPPRKKAPAADQAKAAERVEADGPDQAKAAKKADGQQQQAEARPVEAAAKPSEPPANQARAKTPDLVDPQDLVLGSATDKTDAGYRMELQLEQKGAGVESVLSSRFDAEFEGGPNPHRPLQLLRRDPIWPPSLALSLSSAGAGLGETVPKPEKPEGDADAAPEVRAAAAEDLLDSIVWEVVPGDDKAIRRTISGEDPATGKTIEGQEVVFRTTAANGVVVTKTIRLWQTANGFEVLVGFESPDKERTFTYNLLGPHGLPIEGEWYTSTFREVVFGTHTDRGKVRPVSHTAYDIAKATKDVDSTALPLRFTGVENQYFATFLMPYPAPTSEENRVDRKTTAIVLHKDEKSLQKSDVGVRMSSKPVKVGPNLPVVHTYRVFAGPKTPEALEPYNASVLATYRKSSIIPFAGDVARIFITPTLTLMHHLTTTVAELFGGKSGNWGVAIILLTLFVKLLMFPLGRKQALMAQRTQELQPLVKQIQEKYKDDKEKAGRETLALYSKHGANPISGCIPALIQMPIFFGLWQALNTSVALRHSPFLWINDLAAPDMLFRFPFEISLPFGISLGRWFNLLPILVVGLMLVQTKLFSPPATTPEAEMQQKTMKFMMVAMAVVFYKVPSGLGIYFITSSLWSIGERLLLPKISHATAAKAAEGEVAGGGRDGSARGKGGPGGPGGNGSSTAKKPPTAFGQFWERILEEARKDPTYRKMVEQRDSKDDGDKDQRSSSADRRDRDRGKPRARPGRK